ncbi:abc transporter atp-binding protein permease [Tupanvirus deep ocean]|uniref:Abc transporter atp-binding protein permease n=2 Tax=Tupanvirus TaxID=2094720 RepID=A0AC62A7Q4_9VIRU|nr:abc transporter atp-binding protein permease [Tupanvirus deep ocean]QKU33653.1 abc transporter atp-binding protein permease [Tupanvirus deep ocean]
MIEYFINLLNNKIIRLYLSALFLTCSINVLIFEMVYSIIFNKFLLAIFFVLTLLFFFLNTLMVNIKEQYITNYLYTLNIKTIIGKLKCIDYEHISSWPPNEIHEIITKSNYAIDNLLLMIENISYLVFKLFFNIAAIILFKRRLIMLMLMTCVIIAINIYWLIKNKFNKNYLNLDKLHNYTYYLMHSRLTYLSKFFNTEFKNIIAYINIKSYTSFVYINFAMVALYLFLGFNNFTIEDKLYIVIYARNSSYIFTLIQNVILYYDNLKNNSQAITKILILPKKTIVKQSILKNSFCLKLTELEFINEGMDKNIKLHEPVIINHNDKIVLYGESGVGKTTFLNILKGLSKPNKIMLYINDVYQKNHFRQIENTTMLVRHDTFKYFNESIKEFIFEDYQQDYFLLAFLVNITNMKDICNDLNALINNQKISSGEMRRLVLIKAFYQFYMSDSCILLLDELDNGIHQDLFTTILENIFESQYFKNKMIIIISHNKNLHNNKKLFNKQIEIINGTIICHD